MSDLETRTAQVQALTPDDRENMDGEDNPILFAEEAPIDCQSVTLWFPEEDGVMVTEYIAFFREEDEHRYKVEYLAKDGTSIPLTSGSLYEWALNFYKEREYDHV